MREGYSNKKAKEDPELDHQKHTFLGQTYPYHKNIMDPENLGMSPQGTTDAMVQNVAGLVNYAQLLISGGGHANAKTNKEGRDEALGDKFFLKTMGKCHPIKVDGEGKPMTALYNKDGSIIPSKGEKSCEGLDGPGCCTKREDELDAVPDGTCDFIYYTTETNDNTGEEEDVDTAMTEMKNLKDETKTRQTRYVYIDNLPTGKIPGLGNLSGMRGLIPATIENIGHFNPMKIINSISQPAIPPCVKLNMETIKFNGDSEDSANWHHEYMRDTHYVALSDVNDLYPCSFADGINPISGEEIDGCPKHAAEGFENLFKKIDNKKKMLNLKNKPIAKLFNVSFGVLLAYLLWKVLRKEMKM